MIMGMVIALIAAASVMLDLEPLHSLDRISYDIMLPGLDKNPANTSVIILDIDEKSLTKNGQWPWPRFQIARMLKKVLEGKPKSVGIDILFPESDRTSFGLMSKELKSSYGIELDTSNIPPEMIDNDKTLADVLKTGPFYLGLMFRFGKSGVMDAKLPNSPIKILEVNRRIGKSTPYPAASSAVIPIKELSTSAGGLGFVNVLPDSDGIIRRAPLFIRYGNTLYPSLGLLACMRLNQQETVVVETDTEGIVSIRAGDSIIPVDRQGNILVWFRGPSRTFTTISAGDVLDGKIPPETFKDKIVFVGASAEGLMDNHPTPLDRHFPGVEVHATIAGSILEQDFIAMPAWTTGAKGVMAFLAVTIALIVVRYFSTLVAGSILFGVLLIMSMGSMTIFNTYNVFIPPASSMVVYILSFTLLALVRFRSEENVAIRREKELAAARDCAMVGLASLAETRDSDTGRHILRTQRYIKILAQYLLKQKNNKYMIHLIDIDLLVKSSPLHDVGKVGVPDSILLKPGKLTSSEFEEMKRHTIYGAEALAKSELESGINIESSFLKTAREIALTHHEKWDGTGYPYGLKGADIPISGRIMAVADVYDALISERVYKKAVSHNEAAKIIIEKRGTHFDPEVVSAFEALADEFRNISLKYKNN